MAKDKNIVMLCGLIGDDYKYGKTKDGKEYATFSLLVNDFNKELADSTERTNSQQMLRITCFDPKLVEYLRKVQAHRGMRANVFGRLTTFKNEYKGNTFIQMSVAVRDIEIIKTNSN